jgi:hypothetical protein
LLLAQAAFGQFALFQVDGESERAVGTVVNLGTAYPAEPATARFRIRNTADQPAAVTTLEVNGAGFSLSAVPKMPIGLGPQESFEFSVVFQAPAAATYSATLQSDGVSAILLAAVLPGLTTSVGSGGLSFGTIEAGGSASQRVTISNLTGSPMPMAPVSVSGDAFRVPTPPDGTTILQPSDSVGFDVLFLPPGAGNWTGTLAIGDRTYPLRGSAAGPPLPKPALSVDLPDARSAQTGSVTVNFDAPARTAGAGTLTIAFDPLAKGATDPAIQLGVVGRSLPFTIAVGDAGLQPVNFQTGTTAGTIAIAVELGGATDRKTIAIPPAPVAIQSATATRTQGTIEVRVAGFDNTRTAGSVVYTFYDTAGNALPSIAVDNSADFRTWFAGSDLGGMFGLRAVFPVTGDASKITGFAVEMRNSAGNAVTGRLPF